MEECKLVKFRKQIDEEIKVELQKVKDLEDSIQGLMAMKKVIGQKKGEKTPVGLKRKAECPVDELELEADTSSEAEVDNFAHCTAFKKLDQVFRLLP